MDLERAAQKLASGDVIGFPTETVYGLAARIDEPQGLNKIFQVKRRPFFDPLIVHVADLEQAKTCSSSWGPIAQALAEKFWPGPLTLVLEKSDRVSSLITSGLTTVGLRCPRHVLALELLRKVGVPLAAPSANLFGRTSPTQASHVVEEFKGQVEVLDGGPCEVGIESSILKIDGKKLSILRPGRVQATEIEQELSRRNLEFQWQALVKPGQAPGQLQHHYMPAKPLLILRRPLKEVEIKAEVEKRLSQLPEEIEGVQIQKPTRLEKLAELALPDDPVLAARGLYQGLREAASKPVDLLWLVWPDSRREGDWSAVWDRLRKAASLQLD